MNRHSYGRAFSFVALVLFLVHMCGASSTYARPGVIAWPVGPCAVQRYVGAERLVLVCWQQDLVQFWPLPSAVQWALPGGDGPAGATGR